MLLHARKCEAPNEPPFLKLLRCHVFSGSYTAAGRHLNPKTSCNLQALKQLYVRELVEAESSSEPQTLKHLCAHVTGVLRYTQLLHPLWNQGISVVSPYKRYGPYSPKLGERAGCKRNSLKSKRALSCHGESDHLNSQTVFVHQKGQLVEMKRRRRGLQMSPCNPRLFFRTHELTSICIYTYMTLNILYTYD